MGSLLRREPASDPDPFVHSLTAARRRRGKLKSHHQQSLLAFCQFFFLFVLTLSPTPLPSPPPPAAFLNNTPVSCTISKPGRVPVPMLVPGHCGSESGPDCPLPPAPM
ncbi:uncharacterized protein BO96DRAFT_215562 [Aspergillus niger CBS 101883]|uniref:Uncharacterized protein n=1 Tax=Aspergillus niger ATCC 13496 TaxID=1353008 RepID=A0A370BZ30_ASPNG|nr:uncharacterized protein BO96DRAFT_215562 [Aspergillus niger CBS 101883]PYH59699.1 hypothetical protein BO96DRAFT_215562 [Aspergillus niger CBS 101883]RDH20998.1 hypothetical protein M747DRAFT_28161 [Aspergillus niger ATCC 13496]